jgi:hypothetical protein
MLRAQFTQRRLTDTLSVRGGTSGAVGRDGTGMVKKVLTWGSIAFLIFFIAYRPESAAQVAKSIGSGLADLANGFTDFFTNLVS